MPASLESLPENLRQVNVMQSLYRDLSLYSKTDGLFFDSKIGKHKWIDNSKETMALTKLWTEAAEPYFFFNRYTQRISRNIHPLDTNFTQNLVEFSKNYDSILIEVRPYSLGGVTTKQKAKNWLLDIVQRVKDSNVEKKQILFDFSVVNPKTSENLSSEELISWIKLLEKHQIISFGYYPNRYLFDEKMLQKMKPYVSSNRDITRK